MSSDRAVAFNQSSFGHWINSPTGRLFRVTAGIGFLVLGWRARHTARGKASLAWSLLPLSAGAADVCYISAALGGPLPGDRIRALQRR